MMMTQMIVVTVAIVVGFKKYCKDMFDVIACSMQLIERSLIIESNIKGVNSFLSSQSQMDLYDTLKESKLLFLSAIQMNSSETSCELMNW